MDFLLVHNSVTSFINHKYWSTELGNLPNVDISLYSTKKNFNYIHDYHYQAHQKKLNYLETGKLTLSDNFPKF